MNEQARTNLRSLGYVGGGVNENFDFDQDKEDPKDLVKFHHSYAKACYSVNMGKYAKAEVTAQKLLSERPGFWGGHFIMARINTEQDNVAEAIKHLQKTVELKPDHYRSYHCLGNMFHLQGKIREAIVHYQQTLQINPNLAPTYNNLGNMFKLQDKTDQAVSYYQKALEIDPDYVEAYNNLGNMLKVQGRMDEAVSCYQKVLEITPKHSEAYRNLADIYLRQGKRGLAIESYKQILRIEPDSDAAMNNLAWILTVFKENEFHDPKVAIQLAQQCCELTNYENPNFLDTLSVAYAAAAKFPQAIETAKKALDIASAAGQEKAAERILMHLNLFKAAQPYMEPIN